MTDIDWSDCSIVERDPEKLGGIPTVRAWRISADSIVENQDYGLSAEEIGLRNPPLMSNPREMPFGFEPQD
jgi:uncharacterized protein (DUF433 family)